MYWQRYKYRLGGGSDRKKPIEKENSNLVDNGQKAACVSWASKEIEIMINNSKGEKTATNKEIESSVSDEN